MTEALQAHVWTIIPWLWFWGALITHMHVVEVTRQDFFAWRIVTLSLLWPVTVPFVFLLATLKALQDLTRD